MVHADERIIEFISEIDVMPDASVIVTETITVRAEGNKIKRGIYRDFPTEYRTSSGHRYVVDFDLINVERDGHAEPHHVQRRSNGVRIYIGESDVHIPAGVHTYTLAYYTNRQLGFFADHDELYWNVTGNDWAFPIDRAEARVRLPATVARVDVTVEGYTGVFASKGSDYAAEVDPDGRALFHTTRTLRPREGLTIVVTWPKGHVKEPTTSEKVGYFLRDNRPVVVAVGGAGVLLVYFFFAWVRVGRDPESGVIVPTFEPPENLSPAAMRYIQRMGFDNRTYAAAIINMAVKGYLTITDDDGTFTVERQHNADPAKLSPGERRIVDKLLAGRKSATFKKENHQSIAGSIKALKTLLRNEYHRVYFHTNGIYLIPGVVIAAVTVLASGIHLTTEKPAFLFFSVWLTAWSFTIFVLLRQGQWIMAALFSLFEIGAVFGYSQLASIGSALLLGVMLLANVVFYYLIKAPTESGRKLMDAIEGFKAYLSVAEEQRLNILNPPQQTPEIFEKYLPYALALGVDQQWSEKFANRIQSGSAGERQYSPSWYHGDRWNRFDAASFSSSLSSSFSNAISASSTAPGSSSGSGGGGSSGGGGGGGGGGGW